MYWKSTLASSFLASCILQVWDHGSALQACKCPLCRRPITLLVPSESASRLHRDPEVPGVLRRVEQYNRHFGRHANGLLQVFRLLPMHIFPLTWFTATLLSASAVLFTNYSILFLFIFIFGRGWRWILFFFPWFTAVMKLYLKLLVDSWTI